MKNKKARPDTALLKQDLLELVLYLKKRYHKEKIGILGHSWGSVLGSMFALEHPEHTLLYIGCGQVVNLMENERTGYAKLKQAIEKAGDRKDLRKLAQIGELDQQTPIEISMQYFNEMKAPDKKLYLISNAGHLTMIDNMDEYRRAVVEIVDANRKEQG